MYVCICVKDLFSVSEIYNFQIRPVCNSAWVYIYIDIDDSAVMFFFVLYTLSFLSGILAGRK
jgi:hypothetical protein